MFDMNKNYTAAEFLAVLDAPNSPHRSMREAAARAREAAKDWPRDRSVYTVRDRLAALDAPDSPYRVLRRAEEKARALAKASPLAAGACTAGELFAMIGPQSDATAKLADAFSAETVLAQKRATEIPRRASAPSLAPRERLAGMDSPLDEALRRGFAPPRPSEAFAVDLSAHGGIEDALAAAPAVDEEAELAALEGALAAIAERLAIVRQRRSAAAADQADRDNPLIPIAVIARAFNVDRAAALKQAKRRNVADYVGGCAYVRLSALSALYPRMSGSSRLSAALAKCAATKRTLPSL